MEGVKNAKIIKGKLEELTRERTGRVEEEET
jgi:hypothetical protein